MLDKQGAVHDVEAQQEEIEEDDEAEAQQELSSWGILLTREYVGKDNESKWTVIESGRGASGRFGRHNMLREQPGPTPRATRSVSEDKVSSAWRLFIDSILRHIKRCTEAEAARAGEQNWSLAIEELDAFIALVYVRGAYGCRLVDYDVLWNVNWGTRFFPYTMSRNRFRE